MRKRGNKGWALALLVAPGAVLAEGEVVPPPRALTGEGEFAYLRSSGGGSNRETLKGFSYLRYQRRDWSHELRLEALNEADSDLGIRTRERYFVMEKSSWNFTPRDYLFLRPQYEKDLQSAYEFQAQLALGYGHRFVQTDTLLVSTDIGAGYRHSQQEANGEPDQEAVGNAAFKAEWKFRPGARATEDISVDAGADSTVLRTRTALIFKISTLFGLVVAYETRREDGPVLVQESVTSVALNYQLK